MGLTLRSGSSAACLAAAALLVVAGLVSAHALPQSSNPAPGATLSTSPSVVTITFGETPDPKLSSIKVLDTGGVAVTSGPTAPLQGDALTLVVPVRTLVSGVYTVAWRTVSAVDGHAASGSFAFGVGVTPTAVVSGAEANDAGAPSPAAIFGRWLLYAGFLVLLGAAAFGAFVATPSGGVIRRVLPLAWLAAAAGTVIVLGVQLSDAGEGVAGAMGTSLGPAILGRVDLLVVAALAVALVLRSGARSRIGLAFVALAAAGALVVDTLLSHAAAGPNAPLDVAVQAIHVLAVGLWLGGLAGLVATLRGAPSDDTGRAARRYSRLATVGIATVALTGVLRAIPEVGSVDGLVSTDFGRLVVAKTGLLALLAMLGAVNHFRHVPAAHHALGGLRRVGSLELLVGATAVLLSASLVNLAPPSQVVAAGGSGATVVVGNDFGTSIRARLEVSPGTAGFDTFRATITDYDSGQPVVADGVSLRFRIAARPDIGASRLALDPAGAGTFSATGANMSLDGTWDVTVLVARGAASVEVPLQLTTIVVAPVVDVNATTGLPTIYTVHLSAGRTVQIYADPGTAGQNELHATFFDAAGTELPVTSADMALARAGGAAAPLITRQLEPGHFVSDVVLEAGTYAFSIAGPAPGGEELTTHLDLTISK
ncbi:MAG: copper resistance protein CopC [Candidatus Limnocylindrales bacterium]